MKLDQLTFTRFIAAIAIVVFHFKEDVFPFKAENVKNVVQYFNVLVSYFFVLSGFILSINTKENVDINAFYVNRFARIYPLYISALFLMLFAILMARTPKDTVVVNKVFLSVFLIQAWFQEYALTYNFPSWSLSVEAFFYLCFPFVILLCKHTPLKKQVFYIVLFWFLMQVLFVYLLQNGNYIVLYNPLFHLSTFVMGIVAGKLFTSKQHTWTKHAVKLEALSVFLVLTLSFLIVSRNAVFGQFYENGLLAPVFVVFIYTVAVSKSRLIRIFGDRRLQYLGEISYGIYILQLPVSIIVFGLLDRVSKLSPTTSFFIYLPVLIITSSITYHLIEKPCRIWLKNSFNKSAVI